MAELKKGTPHDEGAPKFQPGEEDGPRAEIQADYTTSVNPLEDFERYLQTLPADLRQKVRLQNTRAVADYISQTGDSSLAHMLPKLVMTSSSEILTTVFPPLRWIVPDYLPPGMTFISGKPKVGKSWLALQLALAVMSGGKLFGKDIEAGPVLYLALEDNPRRLQDRMSKQGWPVNPGVEIMLFDQFRDQIGALNTGGGKRLLAQIEANKYRLVIVDTFSRAIQGDQLDKEAMDLAVGPLQNYALRVDVGMVIIDHMPKNTSGDSDPIAHLYGSVAKSGVGDTFWALYREQGKAGAKLAITGRDVLEYELKLTFDTQGFYWHCEGDAYQIELTTRRKEILEALEEVGRAQAGEIADIIGQSRHHTHERLQELVNSRLVRRLEFSSKIYYELAKK